MSRDKNERVMSLLNSFLGESKDERLDWQSTVTASADYVQSYLQTTPQVEESAAHKAISSKTEQLLDAFLATHDDAGRIDINPMEQPHSVGADSNSLDDSKTVVLELDDKYYTQTLAQVYLKQHRYDKALEIIRSLFLNYPNKSIYFADQIRYLEKLVRINQIEK